MISPFYFRPMNKLFVLILIWFCCSFNNTLAQETNHQPIFDSIIEEANLLYNYEKTVWNASDLLNENEKLRTKNGAYVVFHNADSLTVSFFESKHRKILARYFYLKSDLEKPIRADLELSDPKPIEIDLLEKKSKIIEQLSNDKYELIIPKNYNPNLVLIPSENGYRLYIIMGTTEDGLIPFGNDYIFWANQKGEIINFHKFHSRLIPARSEIPGIGTTVSAMHSHRRDTPYISATDICTFRLYAGYTDLESFGVYSPALKITMVYNLEKNSIEIKD